MLFKEKSFTATKKFIGINELHLEVAGGDSLQNRNYCIKEGDFWEKGDRPMTQKERGEAGAEVWSTIIKQSEEGDFATIKEEYPKVYFHHLKTIQYHRTCAGIKPPELDTLNNFWFYGGTKTGKTLGVKIKYFGKPIYWKDPHNKWWDGYCDEEIVVFDDLDKKKAADWGLADNLKRWCGHEAFLAECKGGNTRYIRPKVMIVTSNWEPKDIWGDTEILEPITRRFKLKHRTTGNVEPLVLKYKYLKVLRELTAKVPITCADADAD